MINTQRLVDTFFEFVKIPSETPNDQDFIAHLDKFFSKMEGAKTKTDAYGNLVVKIPAKGSSNKNTVGFACHADTVKPGIGIKPVIKDGVIKSSRDTILGADDKAGIAEIVEMLLCAKKHPPVEVIIVRCEETGCFGSSNLDYSLVDSKMAYVIDTEETNEVIVGGPTYVILDVYIKGKPAHAGMAPEKGISAILGAAKAISQLRLGRIDNETTSNVGVIQGGEVRNGVPENAKVMIEVRSQNEAKANKLADEMEEIFKRSSKEIGAEVKIDRKEVLKAYFLPSDSEVVKVAAKAVEKNDMKPKIITIMGGTDATLLNAHNIPTAVLGAGYRENHTNNESIKVTEMEIAKKILIEIVESLA